MPSLLSKIRKMKKVLLLIIMIIWVSCKQEKKEWVFHKELNLGKVSPIGLTKVGSSIWLADGDNNRIVQIDENAKIIQEKEQLERPMHIATDGENILIPEYGKDQITIFNKSKTSILALQDSLDAPAGVDYLNGTYAIADFYNHRIIVGKEDDWLSFGQEGKSEGDFYYPTDIQLTKDKIYVADAYNNRVQVFSRKGDFLMSFGKEEKMNAVTGLFVSDKNIFVTDFENDRVLIYDLNGKILQVIHATLQKPTDLLLVDDQLFVTNYKGKSLSIFKLK